MKLKRTLIPCAAAMFALCAIVAAEAQTRASTARRPATPQRTFVVLTEQQLGDIERRLHPDNKVEEIVSAEGSQTRLAVQHESGKADAEAEVHDAADDYFYVLDGTATLTLGGALDNPREASAGEWRAKTITGGQEIKIGKGALVFVPRGTPHRRTTGGQDFSMILIKVFAEPMRAVAMPASRTAKPASKTESRQP